MLKLNKIKGFFSALILSSLALCTIDAQSQDDSFVPCQVMPMLITNHEADMSDLVRYYSPSNGFRWGRISDSGGSQERRDRIVELKEKYLAELSKIDFEELPQECKVDYILFKRDLNNDINEAKQHDETYAEVKSWFPFSDNIYKYLKLRRRGYQLKAKEVAKNWNTSAKQIDSLLPILKEDQSFNKDQVQEAILAVEEIKNSAASVFSFYNDYDPMFTWWVPSTYKALDSSLAKYKIAFEAKLENKRPVDESGIIGYPAGREELVKQLKYEMIPYTPEELIEIANKEFAWCDKELLKAAEEMGFGKDWKAAQEKVKNAYVEPGLQPEAMLDLYNESVEFLKENDLISVPPLAEETWGMQMMSPERQLVNPFFTGGTNITISYPTSGMTYEQKMMSMRGNNPHFSKATVHHELIAGHNLEGFMNSRYRTYRNYRTPFWTEGWSLYWELLLWDEGFPSSPEDRIGMLFWHMHRCARIIFSLNYHLGEWTPQECIDFLVDRVGFERANAEGEVRRSFIGSYPPLYQLAYLTGGRQFYALREELVKTGKMTDKEFHDKIMQLNSMPIEMIRAILTDQDLKENFKTSWKFYDSID